MDKAKPERVVPLSMVDVLRYRAVLVALPRVAAVRKRVRR